MRIFELTLPLNIDTIGKLKLKDKVLLSGELFTARDAAHKRLAKILKNGDDLPFDISKTALFYCGPSPAGDGQICGAIGPTTSYRMDRYVPEFLAAGLRVMIGKGERSAETNSMIRQYHALYLSAIGGISAVLSQHIVSCETYLWQELGTEAIYRMVVDSLPCYVSIC